MEKDRKETIIWLIKNNFKNLAKAFKLIDKKINPPKNNNNK